jgi:hypothetical protein
VPFTLGLPFGKLFIKFRFARRGDGFGFGCSNGYSRAANNDEMDIHFTGS